MRDSSANSLYRAVTGRSGSTKQWGQINAFYTWSKNESDDDNERDSGGVLFDDPFSRRGEYYASKLDRTHQFRGNSIYLPAIWRRGLQQLFACVPVPRLMLLSAPILMVTIIPVMSGRTWYPALELPRNYYRNRPIYDMDLRAEKRFRFGESRSLVLSGEFFNVLDRTNMQIGSNHRVGFPNTLLRRFLVNPLRTGRHLESEFPAGPGKCGPGMRTLVRSTF